MNWDEARDTVDELQHEEDMGHAHGEHESGARSIDEMVRAASVPTVVPPPSTKTMWGQIEYDKKMKALRERRKAK